MKTTNSAQTLRVSLKRKYLLPEPLPCTRQYPPLEPLPLSQLAKKLQQLKLRVADDNNLLNDRLVFYQFFFLLKAQAKVLIGKNDTQLENEIIETIILFLYNCSFSCCDLDFSFQLKKVLNSGKNHEFVGGEYFQSMKLQ